MSKYLPSNPWVNFFGGAFIAWAATSLYYDKGIASSVLGILIGLASYMITRYGLGLLIGRDSHDG